MFILRFFSRQISFALTRDCSQLMERISKCVDQREAVLLSGETGVGKTSVVQLLASYCGVSLKVVNFSEDSDFSDFIGGFVVFFIFWGLNFVSF